MLGADLEADGIRVATLTIAGQIVAGTGHSTPSTSPRAHWEGCGISDTPWRSEFRFTGE